jgi:hypothetical protein
LIAQQHQQSIHKTITETQSSTGVGDKASSPARLLSMHCQQPVMCTVLGASDMFVWRS